MTTTSYSLRLTSYFMSFSLSYRQSKSSLTTFQSRCSHECNANHSQPDHHNLFPCLRRCVSNLSFLLQLFYLLRQLVRLGIVPLAVRDIAVFRTPCPVNRRL